MRSADVVIAPDPEALAQFVAERFVALSQGAVESRGRFSVALSGGSTPEVLYRLLAEEPYADQIPWPDVHVFWADERCVPPEDPGSNYRLADETFISRVAIPTDNVHRVWGELAPEAAARAYRRALEDFFCGPRVRFDLVLLGLGRDGHTASLFPGSAALEERDRLAVAVQATYEDRPAERVTLTLSAINSARAVWFLVTGGAKAGIVREVLEKPGGDWPAHLVQPVAGEVTWLLDAAAAAQLEERT